MGSQQHLHKLLNKPDGPLGQLLHTSRHRASLRAAVCAALPPELAVTVYSATLDDGCLRLGVVGSVWSARLRFLAPRIRQTLSAPDAGWSWGPVQSIDIHVAVSAARETPARTGQPVPLSDASRRHLLAVARDTADPALAAALRALAQGSSTGAEDA